MRTLTRRAMVTAGPAIALLASATCKAFTRTPIEVPIDVGTRLSFDASVDGQPVKLMLDTGGARSLITADAAARLKLPTTGRARAAFGGSDAVRRVATAAHLALGSSTIGPINFVISDGDMDLGAGIDGTIGAEILSLFSWHLDLDRGSVTLFAAEMPASQDWRRVESARSAGAPFFYLPVEFGGRRLKFAIDTGMLTSARIFDHFGAVARSLADRPWAPAPPDGRGRLVRVPELTVADRRFAGQLLSIAVGSRSQSVFGDGLLGLPVASRFNLIFDASRQQLWVQNNRRKTVDERYNRAGVWLERTGDDVRVSVVAPGSSAERAGIATGDTIVGTDWKKLLDMVEQPAGTIVAVDALRRGVRRRVEIVLTDLK